MRDLLHFVSLCFQMSAVTFNSETYLTGAKRQIGDTAPGFMCFSDNIQHVASRTECSHQRAQDSDRKLKVQFFFLGYVHGLLYPVLFITLPVLYPCKERAGTRRRLLTQFREVSDLNLYRTLTTLMEGFRRFFTPFMRNSETSADSMLGWRNVFGGSTWNSSRMESFRSCVNVKPTATPTRTRPDRNQGSLQCLKQLSKGPYHERPTLAQPTSHNLLKIRLNIILPALRFLKIRSQTLQNLQQVRTRLHGSNKEDSSILRSNGDNLPEYTENGDNFLYNVRNKLSKYHEDGGSMLLPPKLQPQTTV